MPGFSNIFSSHTLFWSVEQSTWGERKNLKSVYHSVEFIVSDAWYF